MEEGHPAVMKGVKITMFFGWKYRHYFVVAVTVIVTLIFMQFSIPAVLVSLFCNLPDICMHDCVK